MYNQIKEKQKSKEGKNMIKQAWRVTFENAEHTVEYKYSRLSGKTVLTVDGDSFTVKGKPFGIGVERRETIMVGMSQAILSVSKSGKADIIFREGRVERI